MDGRAPFTGADGEGFRPRWVVAELRVVRLSV